MHKYIWRGSIWPRSIYPHAATAGAPKTCQDGELFLCFTLWPNSSPENAFLFFLSVCIICMLYCLCIFYCIVLLYNCFISIVSCVILLHPVAFGESLKTIPLIVSTCLNCVPGVEKMATSYNTDLLQAGSCAQTKGEHLQSIFQVFMNHDEPCPCSMGINFQRSQWEEIENGWQQRRPSPFLWWDRQPNTQVEVKDAKVRVKAICSKCM